jgi:hypothetical protein
VSINNNILIAIVIVIVAITLVVILFGLKYLLASVPSDVGLPILAIGGVVMLLGTLALVSVAFSLFNLDDKSQALALPEGSIRAVIALSLIILFAIVTVYFYSTLSSTGVSTATGLSVTLRDSFLNSFKDQVVAVTPQTGDGPFTVYFRQGGNVAGADFAKQVLVLIGTLVTAVSSFYFASRVTTADGAPAAGVARSAPEIRGIAPQSQTRGAAGATFEFAINGDRLDLVKEAKIVSGPNQIVATDVVSNASAIRCKLELGPNVATGAWDLIVTDGIGRTATLPAALTIT